MIQLIARRCCRCLRSWAETPLARGDCPFCGAGLASPTPRRDTELPPYGTPYDRFLARLREAA